MIIVQVQIILYFDWLQARKNMKLLGLPLEALANNKYFFTHFSEIIKPTLTLTVRRFRLGLGNGRVCPNDETNKNLVIYAAFVRFSIIFLAGYTRYNFIGFYMFTKKVGATQIIIARNLMKLHKIIGFWTMF